MPYRGRGIRQMKRKIYQFISSALTACMLLSNLGTMAVNAAPKTVAVETVAEEEADSSSENESVSADEGSVFGDKTASGNESAEPVEEKDVDGEGEWDWLNNVYVSYKYSFAGYSRARYDVYINADPDKPDSARFVLFATKDSSVTWLTEDMTLDAVPAGAVSSNNVAGNNQVYNFFLPNGNAQLDPDSWYYFRMMVQDNGAYHTLGDSDAFKTDPIPEVSVSASAASYTADVKATFSSEYDDADTADRLRSLRPIIIYTDDSSKDLFSGKNVSASLDAYQQKQVYMQSAYLKSESKESFYARFNLGDEAALKPGKEYRYRIALEDLDRYYFVSGVKSFTTRASVSQSAVSINDITIVDYGYEAETVRFRIANPDGETIVRKEILNGSGVVLPDAEVWEVDEEDDYDEAGEDTGPLYETTVPVSSNATIRLVVYTGEEPTETPIDFVLSGNQIKRRDTASRTITVNFNELLTGVEAEFTLKPVYEVDDYHVSLYYKKATDSSYWEVSRNMGNEEQLRVSVKDMEPDQDYQYYLTLTSPYRLGEIIYQNGSAEAPHTMHTGAPVSYTRDDFKDKALYYELEAKGWELTNVSLAKCEYLEIDGISGTTPIKSLDDIPEKFPGLETLEITGQDITDISPLLSMKELRSVNLAVNEIATLPDLSAVKWQNLSLVGNYVTYADVRSRAGFRGSLNISDPREREVSALETVYTDVAGKFPLVLRYDGKNDNRRYSFTVSMGSVSKTYNRYDEGVYYSGECNYGAFAVADIKNDFSLESGKDYSFRIIVRDQYHTEALCDRTVTMRFETPEYKPGEEYITPAMSTLSLYQTLSANTLKEDEIPVRAEIRKGGKVYFTSDDPEVSTGNICADMFRKLLDWNSYYVESNTGLVYNAIRINTYFDRMLIPAAGDYDVYYYDESGKLLLKVEGKIHVSADSVVVDSEVPVYGYGNNDKYLYVQVYGQNLSASDAPVIADGKETFTEFVSVRQFGQSNYHYEEEEGYYGFDKYVFKLRKKDNWKKILTAAPTQEYSLLINGKKVTDLRPDKEKKVRASALQGDFSAEALLSSAEYNWKKDLFEFSFRAPIAEGSTISAEIGYWDNGKDDVIMQANGSGVIDENGVLRMRFYDAGGMKYAAVNDRWVYVRFYMNGKALSDYPKEFQIVFHNYYTEPTYGSSVSGKRMNGTLENQYYREGAVSINLLCTGPAEAHQTDVIYVQVVQDVCEEENYAYVTKVVASTSLNKAEKDKSGNDVFKKDAWKPDLPKGQYTLRYYELRNGSEYNFSSWQIYVACEGFVVTFDNAYYFGGGKEANLFLTAPYMAKENVDKKDIPAFVSENKLELKIYDKQRKLVTAESTVNQVNKSGTIGWYIKGLDPEAEGYYFAVSANGLLPTDIYGTKLYRMVVDWDDDDNAIYDDDPCGNWYSKKVNISGYSMKDGYDGIEIDDRWENAPYKLRFYRASEAATLITEITVKTDQLKNSIYYLTEEDVEPLDPDEIYLCTITDSKNKVIGTLTGYFRSEPDRFRDSSKKVQLRSVKILNATSLFVGETKQLSVQFTPSDATTKTVSWNSSNPAVATISNYGYVRALSEGQTTITLKSTDTKVKAVTYVLQVIDKNKGLYVEFVDQGPFVYSGKKITPNVAVYYGGKKLTEGTDYKMTYSNNLNASVNTKAKIKVAGITVAGTVEKEFTIRPRSLDDSAVKVAETIVESGKKAIPVLYLGNYKLTAKDYSFDKDAKFTSNGSMVVTGKGNFKGSRVIDVTVGKPLKFKVSYFKAADRTYNGQEQKLTANELTVVDATTLAVLKEGTDYILSYQEDIRSAGTKKVSIIGIGKYNTVISRSFKINPLKARGVSVKMPLSEVYHPGTITTDITTIHKTTYLIPNVDYTVKYNKNTKIGKAEVRFSFAGNYKGTQTIIKTFDIVKASISANNVNIYCPDLAWVKDAKYISEPNVTMDGKQISKSDYTVTYTLSGNDISKKKITKADLGKDNVAVVTVTVEGKGNMKGKATTTYRVVYSPKENDLSKAKLTIRDQNGKKVSSLPYTGTEVEFKGDYRLEVVLSGVTLKEGVDYKIEYVNNINKGTAIAIVTGLGETSTEKTKYYGSKSLKFTIKKGTLSWH